MSSSEDDVVAYQAELHTETHTDPGDGLVQLPTPGVASEIIRYGLRLDPPNPLLIRPREWSYRCPGAHMTNVEKLVTKECITNESDEVDATKTTTANELHGDPYVKSNPGIHSPLMTPLQAMREADKNLDALLDSLRNCRREVFPSTPHIGGKRSDLTQDNICQDESHLVDTSGIANANGYIPSSVVTSTPFISMMGSPLRRPGRKADLESSYCYKFSSLQRQIFKTQMVKMKSKTDEMRGKDEKIKEKFFELQQKRLQLGTPEESCDIKIPLDQTQDVETQTCSFDLVPLVSNSSVCVGLSTGDSPHVPIAPPRRRNKALLRDVQRSSPYSTSKPRTKGNTTPAMEMADLIRSLQIGKKGPAPTRPVPIPTRSAPTLPEQNVSTAPCQPVLDCTQSQTDHVEVSVGSTNTTTCTAVPSDKNRQLSHCQTETTPDYFGDLAAILLARRNYRASHTVTNSTIGFTDSTSHLFQTPLNKPSIKWTSGSIATPQAARGSKNEQSMFAANLHRMDTSTPLPSKLSSTKQPDLGLSRPVIIHFHSPDTFPPPSRQVVRPVPHPASLPSPTRQVDPPMSQPTGVGISVVGATPKTADTPTNTKLNLTPWSLFNVTSGGQNGNRGTPESRRRILEVKQGKTGHRRGRSGNKIYPLTMFNLGSNEAELQI